MLELLLCFKEAYLLLQVPTEQGKLLLQSQAILEKLPRQIP